MTPADTPTPAARTESRTITNRATLIVGSHIGFLATTIVLIVVSFENSPGRTGLIQGFAWQEVGVIVAGLYAAGVTRENVSQWASSPEDVLSGAEGWEKSVDNWFGKDGVQKVVMRTRWVTMWLAILGGFIAAGSVVVSTGGFGGSPFVQFPLTMVVLGAMMTDQLVTAGLVFLIGFGYSMLLVLRPPFLDYVLAINSLGDPTSKAGLALSVTAVNLLIGVLVSFLSRRQGQRRIKKVAAPGAAGDSVQT